MTMITNLNFISIICLPSHVSKFRPKAKLTLSCCEMTALLFGRLCFNVGITIFPFNAYHVIKYIKLTIYGYFVRGVPH